MLTSILRRYPLLYLLLGLPLLASQGCVRYYYAPSQHNVPMFREKNDARVSGAYFNSSEMKGFEINAAYAMTKESAVLANATVVNPGSDLGTGQLYEVGAGIFKPLSYEPGTVGNRFIFEVYGFAGAGNTKHFYAYPDDHITAGIFKTYAQPSIAFSTHYFDIAVSSKVGILHTFNINRSFDAGAYPPQNNYAEGRTAGDDYILLTQNRTPFIFEPAVTLNVGYKFIKVQAQAGWSVMSSDFRYLNSGFSARIGLIFCYSKAFFGSNTP